MKVRTGTAAPLWDAGDVAHFLKIPKREVYRLVHEGSLPSVRVGRRRLRFRQEDVVRVIRSSAADDRAPPQP
jgi:excisionase family DNA binding protein